jgi:tetratricopeptide (TPR) repeat protein
MPGAHRPAAGSVWPERAERTIVAIVAVRTTTDRDVDAATRARLRLTVCDLVQIHGGQLYDRNGEVLTAVWRLSNNPGEHAFQAASACAAELTRRLPEARVAVEAGVADVWTSARGDVVLVSGDIVVNVRDLTSRVGGSPPSTGPRLLSFADLQTSEVLLLKAHRRLRAADQDGSALQCMAVLGGPLDVEGLAAVLGEPVASAQQAIARLAGRGLVTLDELGAVWPAGRRGCQLVARTVPPEQVRLWSRRLARYLNERADDDIDLASRAAHHAERGHDWPLAFASWRRVALLATTAGEPRRASHALDRAAALQDHTGEPSAHLDVLALRASTQGALLGNAHPNVVAAYRACIRFAEMTRQTDAASRFDVLFGLQASHLVRGEITSAEAIGRELVADKPRQEPDVAAAALRLYALTSLLAGRPRDALAIYQRALALCSADADPRMLLRLASDQRAVALAGLAWAEAMAGRYEASVKTATAAEERAATVAHPHTSCHVLCVLATRAALLHDGDTAAHLAAEAHDIARRHGLIYWRAWADVVLGWHLATRSLERGLARLVTGLHDYKATGSEQAIPFFLLLKADVEMRAGATAAAGITIARAERGTRPGGVELYRAPILTAAAHVALRVQGPRPAMRLATKAYKVAVTQSSEHFAAGALDRLMTIATDGSADLETVAGAVRRHLA